MLTKRQNMLEVVRGGNPDRLVKQYEALSFVMNTPYAMQYPLMPAGPGAETVKCAWGYYNAWPAGQPGAFPVHDAEHIVCPDISEWKKYVKAPAIDYTEEDWKPAMEAAAAIDRNEYFVTCRMSRKTVYLKVNTPPEARSKPLRIAPPVSSAPGA